MTSIAARLAAATGPDRDLDYAIAEWATPFLSVDGYKRFGDDGGWISAAPSIEGAGMIARAAAYTTSIDAAVALVEAKLPGWFRGQGLHSWGAEAVLYTGEGNGRVRHCGCAPTEPLAILLALFAALEAHPSITAPSPTTAPCPPQASADGSVSQADARTPRT